jgi:hypothetical protein
MDHQDCREDNNATDEQGIKMLLNRIYKASID